MISAAIARRHRLLILFLMAIAIMVAAVGSAPILFLIWMLKILPRTLGL